MRIDEQAGARRRRTSAARRDVLAQCRRCKLQATARVNENGKITSVDMAAEKNRDQWLHRRCGGVLAYFDHRPKRTAA